MLSDHVEVQHKQKGKEICSLTVQEGGKEPSALGRVVIIQLEGTEEQRKKFKGSSIRVAELLEESKFGRVGIKNVKSNFWKGTLSIEIGNMEQMAELLEIKELGELMVKCYQPISHVESKCVIGPIGVYEMMRKT